MLRVSRKQNFVRSYFPKKTLQRGRCLYCRKTPLMNEHPRDESDPYYRRSPPSLTIQQNIHRGLSVFFWLFNLLTRQKKKHAGNDKTFFRYLSARWFWTTPRFPMPQRNFVVRGSLRPTFYVYSEGLFTFCSGLLYTTTRLCSTQKQHDGIVNFL